MADSQLSSQGNTQPLSFSMDGDEMEAKPWGRLCPTTPIKHKYKLIELSESMYTFGRDANKVDITLNEPQISSRHCQIERSDDNPDRRGAWVHDLSTNGTFLNKNKIGKGKKHMMFDGDELVFIQYTKNEKRTGM